MATSSSNTKQNIYIINSADEWKNVEERFFYSIGSIRAIGLDCEWVTVENFAQKDRWDRSTKSYNDRIDQLRRSNAAQGKVALLQLASHDETIVLIRLCLFDKVPESLRELLEDPDVVKVGVNIEEDVKKLFTTWSVLVTNFVDLRNIVGHNGGFWREYDQMGIGLKRLGAFFSGNGETEYDPKKNPVRHSNWAARSLNLEQIDYASKDALMAIESLMVFATKYMDGMPKSKSDPEFWPKLRSRLMNHIGRPCSRDLVNWGKPVSAKRAERPSETLDASSSDVELDFSHFQQGVAQRLDEADGENRAVLFYETDKDGKRGAPMAAIDSAFLAAMARAGERTAHLRFKMAGPELSGKEVKVSLRRRVIKK